MRAVQLTAFGNPVDGLEYVDLPEPDAPGPNQVLIGVEFSPITLTTLCSHEASRGHTGIPITRRYVTRLPDSLNAKGD